ncbi:restriction endonuclease subunit S [Microcystis aeruginosa NIES-87]|nr:MULTISPECIES: restriction endonuclease subunit S [Microcystis]WNF13727.1 restriction endonuclease subunit S [Microcystis aeruginosa NRERC-214]GBE74028.1 restriction endonuclease subunit S [Microcystis aeruginosa NIES-87]
MKSKWKIYQLSEVTEIVSGGTPKSEVLEYWDGDVLWITPKDMGQAKTIFVSNTSRTISRLGLQKSSAKLIPKNSVILSTRAPIGHLIINVQEMATNQGCRGLIPKNNLDTKFLFYFLKSNIKLLNDLGTGTTFKELSRNALEKIKIPVPPIEEQKRIVEILDKAFEGIAQAEANTRQSLINIRNFFKRYLDKSIHKNNSNWDRVKFQDILSQQPRNGWSPPAENHSDIGVPVLTLSSVTGFHFNIQKIKFTNAPVKVGAHYWLNNGEFLMTRSNTSELVGHVAICENITEPTICCDLIMKMSINPQWAETKFIYWYFRTSKLRHLISNSAQGANPTMKKINKAIVQNFPVFIPPIVEQKKIVEQIEECYQKTQKLETIYQRKLEAIAELKQSILEKAFTGQLSQ